MAMRNRRIEQFYCSTECRKYFKTYLRQTLNGNYTIECPNCNHHHHRVIKDGYVTGDRCNSDSIKKDIIRGLKCTVTDFPDHFSPENRRKRIGLVK